MIMSLKQWEKELKPRRKLNHNIQCIHVLSLKKLSLTNDSISRTCKKIGSLRCYYRDGN